VLVWDEANVNVGDHDGDIVSGPRPSYGARPAMPLHAVLGVTEGKRQEKKSRDIENPKVSVSGRGRAVVHCCMFVLSLTKEIGTEERPNERKHGTKDCKPPYSQSPCPIVILSLKCPRWASKRAVFLLASGHEKWKPCSLSTWNGELRRKPIQTGLQKENQRFAVRWGQIRTKTDGQKENRKGLGLVLCFARFKQK
jgi:hypothetical protein